MNYKWQRTSRTDNLTIVMVARNLVSLCYPFIESIISTIPIGCKYLVGNFGNDNTKSILMELDKYIPIEVVDLEWALDKDRGWGAATIGCATQDIVCRSPTEYVLNLQACEVYTDSAIATIMGSHPWLPDGLIGPWEFRFNHFFGSMNHGGPGYGGYGTAPRVYKRDTKFNRTDGYIPNDYGGSPVGGWINRYGYCHHNTIDKKMRNHADIYCDGDPAPKIAGCINLGNTQTWFDGHPPCVEHLVNKKNYDINFSLLCAKKILAKRS